MEEQKAYASCRGLVVTSELSGHEARMRTSSVCDMQDDSAFAQAEMSLQDDGEPTDLSTSRVQRRRTTGYSTKQLPASRMVAKRKKHHFGRGHGGKQDIGTVLDRRRLVRQIIEQRGAFITLSEVVQLLPERLRCNPCTISRDLSAMRIHHLRKGPLSTVDRERLNRMQDAHTATSDAALKDSTKRLHSDYPVLEALSPPLTNCYVSLDRLEPPSMVVASNRGASLNLPTTSTSSSCVSALARSSSPDEDDGAQRVLPRVLHIKSAPGCDTQSAESISTSASSPKVVTPFVTSILIFMPGEDVPIRLTRCSKVPLSFAEFKRLVPRRAATTQYRYFFKTLCTDIEEAPVVYEELPFIGEDVNENDIIVPLWNGLVFARLENFE